MATKGDGNMREVHNIQKGINSYTVAQLIVVLRNKPDGRGFDS